MNGSFFPRDMFAELDRMQRDLQRAFEVSPSIRGLARGGFPALNAGGTPQTIEVYAFAPGIDPATLEVVVERGTLTLAGERKSSLPAEDRKTKVHINERFSGRFRRVVSLPDDADPDAVEAGYRDGVLHISVRRSESARPRRIEIQ